VKLYERLLDIYPRHFRERYAGAMRRTFAQERAGISRRGSRALTVFWISTIAHAIWFGLRERLPKGLTMRAFFTFDVRDALRSLRATPVITGVAILSLALGIGANTALFSILNGLVLKPLPVRAPHELALIDDGSWTNPIWEDLRGRVPQLFEGAFAWSSSRFDLAASGQRDSVAGAYASGSMFEVLGVPAEVGRTFTAADDVRGSGPDGPVVVISHRLWQDRYGGQIDALGTKMLINRVPFTIIGVTPPDFLGPDVGSAEDVFVPLGSQMNIAGKESMLDVHDAWWLEIMIRRKPGQSLEQAAAALNSVRAAMRDTTMPGNWDAKNRETYLSTDFKLIAAANGVSSLRARYAGPLTIILVVVAAVLLIACANIANLLLARATARRHEMSLRLALGASRFRLVRQLLAESALLAICGGVAGLFLAKFGGALLVRQLGSSATSVTLDLSIDWRVLAFTAVVALVTTILFGLAPSVGLASVEPNDALKEQTRSVTGDRRFGLRNFLVITQVSLSLTLVVGAGLFVRSFTSLSTMHLGFDPSKLMLVNVDAARANLAPDARLPMFDRVRDIVAAVPGVRAASVSFFTPISGVGWNGRMLVEGGPELPIKERMIWVNPIQAGWFNTYGMTLKAGRDFSSIDGAGGMPVAIVNETFVKRFIGSQNPIGTRTKGGIGGPDTAESLTIIGVVSDSVYRNARSGVYATVYVPMAQTGRVSPSFSLTVDVAGDRPTVQRAIGAALSQADSRLAFSTREFADQVRASTAQERLVAMLSGFFGGLALLLAALGLYGVTSYSVSRRRSEIAVRMALGAGAGTVVRMVLERVVWLVIAGVAIGVGLSAWAGKYIETLLYGLEPRDTFTMIAAALVLLGAGLVAGWLPARRASRLDPTVVLRD
jgi:predicted permease